MSGVAMTARDPRAAEFHALERTPQGDISGADWDTYYAALIPWLRSPDADIRSRAINRLFMAALWSEPRDAARPMARNPRVAWLLGVIDEAQRERHDVIAFVLDQIRYQDTGDADDPVPPWLERLRAAPPEGVPPEIVEGAILMRQPFDADDPAAVARLVALLDHPSDHIRACAARSMSACDGEALDAAAMFALVKEKDIVRPGIAGAYWTEWSFCRDSVPVDPAAWMMEILERRSGPEPTGLPFNGIDFHLHEICGAAPAMITRMIDAGHIPLAIESATEMRRAIDGMEPVLQRLAADTDALVRARAQRHLAGYYRVLHPEAEERGMISRWQDASADVFGLRLGESGALSVLVIYPPSEAAGFTDAEAWSIVDRLLPPDMRGAVAAHPLASPKSPPGPYRLGGQMMWRFASGPSLEMHGDPDARTWTRIDIIGGSLKAWEPFPTRA
jgi:hypothetical protein